MDNRTDNNNDRTDNHRGLAGFGLSLIFVAFIIVTVARMSGASGEGTFIVVTGICIVLAAGGVTAVVTALVRDRRSPKSGN